MSSVQGGAAPGGAGAAGLSMPPRLTHEHATPPDALFFPWRCEHGTEGICTNDGMNDDVIAMSSLTELPDHLHHISICQNSVMFYKVSIYC